MNLWFAMTLTLLAPGQVDTADEQARADGARGHYRANRFATAASEFERLWRDYKVAKYLYNAGLAREGLGHDARAILAWQQFLAQPGVGAAEAARARAKLEAALARTTPVRLRLGPPEALVGSTLRIQRDDGDPNPVQISVGELGDGARDRALHLEPANWVVSLEPAEPLAAAYARGQATLDVARGQAEAVLELALVAKPAAILTVHLSPRRARRVGATLTLQRDHDGQAPLPLRLRTAHGSTTRQPGRWHYTASAPGFHEQHGTLDLAGAQTLDIRLERDLSAEDLRDRRARLGLGLGLGLAGLAASGAGALVLVTGESQYDPKQILTWRRPNDVSSAGVGLLAASAGFYVGAVTGAVRPSARAAWWTELAVGAAALAGGITMYRVGQLRYSDLARQTDVAYESGQADERGPPGTRAVFLGGAAIAGAGGGLLASAITGILVRRRLVDRRARDVAVGTAGAIGLSIRGAF